MKILLVDNFDSFTFNLVHYLEALGCEVDVYRSNAIPFDLLHQYSHVVLSPGPGLPKDSPGMMQLIDTVYNKVPILGVCLGMQALAVYFGDNLVNLNEVKHGVKEQIVVEQESLLFQNIPSHFGVGLYHSWSVELTKTSSFIPLAYSENRVLMAIEHTKYSIFGVQFHPESILTDYGKELLNNFIQTKKPL